MANGFIEDIPPGISQAEFDVRAGPLLRQMAPQASARHRIGQGLVNFAAGFSNPLGAAQMIRQQQATKMAAIQMALEALPEGDIRRDQLAAQFDQMIGVPGASAAFRRGPEQSTLSRGQTLVERSGPGQPFQEVARGQPLPAQGTDPVFGKSQSALAMDAVLRARNKQRQGVPLTEEDRDQLAFSRQILSAPRIIQGPGGSLIQAAPIGIPQQFESVFDEVPENLGRTQGGTQIERVSQQERAGQFKITQLRGPTELTKDFDTVISVAGDIEKLLREGRGELGGITGVVGAAKAAGGGLARQAGIPVSGRAKQLQRKLETLKAIAASHLLGESGRTLSDQDRRRLDGIVGTLDALTDEQDIREALINVIEIMERMQQ